VHPPTITQGYADPAGNGRPALRWDLNPPPLAEIAEITGDVGSALRWDGYPTPIGGSLAEIAEITGDVGPALRWDGYPTLIGGSLAEIAEITGDVGSALRWDGYPTPIGGSLAETAETPASQVIRKRIISRQEVQPSRHHVSKPPVPGFPSPAPALRSCADCAAPRACPSPAGRCARSSPCRPSPRRGSWACRARG
jgi:hypothetical protein